MSLTLLPAKTESALIAQYLAGQFPWLNEQDADISGADVVDQLGSMYETLQEHAK